MHNYVGFSRGSYLRLLVSFWNRWNNYCGVWSFVMKIYKQRSVKLVMVEWGSVHATLKESVEYAVLFLRLGLLSTLIRHENGAFRKRSSNWRNLKTLAFRLGVEGKKIENVAFLGNDDHVISLSEFNWKKGDCCVCKFLVHCGQGLKWQREYSMDSSDVW